MMYENNAVNEMIANLLQVSVEDLMMLGYDLESLAITNPEHMAHVARKTRNANQRKNDFSKKNRQKKMSSYASRSGKSIKDNGAVHSRACRTTYGMRPKPKRWTNADALAVMDEYEKNVRQDTLEYYEAMEALLPFMKVVIQGENGSVINIVGDSDAPVVPVYGTND